MATGCEGWNRGSTFRVLRPLLFALVLQVSGLLPQPFAVAQAPGYSKEEVAAQGGQAGTTSEPGIPVAERSTAIGRDMLMSGSRSIGSARGSVRGGGESAMLRYYQHRDVQPPSYAAIRIGPFYSDLGISQSVGYRYIRMEGTGVDFLTGNNRGQFLKDGSDFPLVSSLTLNNYLIISRHIDLEANIRVSYEHYPLKTQEDQLDVDLTDEGVYATFSSEFNLSRDTRLLVYDDILYRTDYVDTRGISDRYGGQEYEYFQNTVGADWDWKPSPFDNFSLSAARSDQIPFDDEFELQERVQYTEMASYQRELTAFATAGLLGEFAQSFYEVDTRSDIYMYGFSALVAAQLTRRVTGNAALGYQQSSYVDGPSGGSSRGSLSAGFELGHQISEEKSQTLSYDRTQTEAFEGGVDIRDLIGYRLQWDGGLFPGSLSTQFSMFDPQDEGRSGYSDWSTNVALQHQLTRLVRLRLSTMFSMRVNADSDVAIDPETPDINSDYQTLSVRLGAEMPITRKTAFVTYAEHADRTSDNENLAYTRDIIAAILIWSHEF